MNSKDKVYVFDNIKYLLKTNWGIDISDFDLSELLLDTAFIFQISKWITNLKKIEQEKLNMKKIKQEGEKNDR